MKFIPILLSLMILLSALGSWMVNELVTDPIEVDRVRIEEHWSIQYVVVEARTVEIVVEEKIVYAYIEVPNYDAKRFPDLATLDEWLRGVSEELACVPGAEELQRLAFRDGYQLGWVYIIHEGKETGHMWAGAIIGKNIYKINQWSGFRWKEPIGRVG